MANPYSVYGFVVHQGGVPLFGPTMISDEPGNNQFNVGLQCAGNVPVFLTISGLEGLPAGKVLKAPYRAEGVYGEGGTLLSTGTLSFQGTVEDRLLFVPSGPVSVTLSGEVRSDDAETPPSAPVIRTFSSYSRSRSGRGRARRKRF